MHTSLFLLALVGSLVCVTALPTPPTFAKVYNVTIRYTDLDEKTVETCFQVGDVTNQRELVFYPSLGQLTIMRYDDQKQYNINTTSHECTWSPLDGQVDDLGLPSDATYVGTSVIDGKTVDVWGWGSDYSQVTFYNVANQPVDKQIPVRVVQHMHRGFVNFDIQTDYLDYQPLHSVPEKYFELPANLKGRCRM